jgi:hypothetical protein
MSSFHLLIFILFSVSVLSWLAHEDSVPHNYFINLELATAMQSFSGWLKTIGFMLFDVDVFMWFHEFQGKRCSLLQYKQFLLFVYLF